MQKKQKNSFLSLLQKKLSRKSKKMKKNLTNISFSFSFFIKTNTYIIINKHLISLGSICTKVKCVYPPRRTLWTPTTLTTNSSWTPLTTSALMTSVPDRHHRVPSASGRRNSQLRTSHKATQERCPRYRRTLAPRRWSATSNGRNSSNRQHLRHFQSLRNHNLHRPTGYTLISMPEIRTPHLPTIF